MTPEQVLANSDAVMLGRVESASPRWTRGVNSWIVTDYTIRVERVIGDRNGFLSARTAEGRITLTFSGGEIGEVGCEAHGVPKLNTGDRAFFVLRRSDLHAACPVFGWWQGLYKVRTIGNAERVVRADSCCGSDRVVQRHFFAKTQTMPGGFTVDAFADEVSRALPLARADAGLNLADLLRNRRSTTATENVTPAGQPGESGGDETAPARGAAEFACAAPVVEAPRFTDCPADSQRIFHRSPFSTSLRYGFNYRWPNTDYTSFNVPPAMGSFHDQFITAQAYWNFTCSDVFRYRNNSDNSIGTPNLRNDCAFLTDSQRDDLFGGAWGSTELGVCHALYIPGANIITETDIGFNAGKAWTTSAELSRLSPSNFYFLPVAIHELGHAFGLKHQWDSDPNANWMSIMNYYADDQFSEIARIFADDAQACRAFYGSRAATLRDAGVYMLRNDGTRTGTANNENTVVRATLSAGTVTRGTTFQIQSFTVDNPGTQPFNVTLNHWLCPTYGSFDNAVYCGSSTIYVLNPGASGWFTRTFAVPASTPVGNYYAAIALSNDDDGSNNAAWTNTRVSIIAPRPANDDPINAITIDTRGGTYGGTTLGGFASVPGCGSSNGPDVWFAYFPVGTGTLKLDTCGSAFDTYLEVFERRFDGLPGASIACNDDGGAFSPCTGSLQSYFAVSIDPSRNYLIRIAGFQGGYGDYSLHARLVPANDFCTGAFPINQVGTVYGTTRGAAASGTGLYEACDVQFVGTVSMQSKPDVWFAYTAPCGGPVSFHAAGTGADAGAYMTVAAYELCQSPFLPIHCLSCGDPTASVNATAGSTYYLRVRAMQDPGADFVLDISAQIDNDDYVFLFGIPSNVMVSLTATSPVQTKDVQTLCASSSVSPALPPITLPDFPGPFDPGRDVFYYITTDTPGTLLVSRCNNDFQPVLALYDASNLYSTGIQLLIAGSSSTATCEDALIQHLIVPGATYFVRIGGSPYLAPSSGSTQLTFTLAPLGSGACCGHDGTCALTDQLSCSSANDGSMYQGDGVPCDPLPCVVPTGACCAADGSCALLAAADCLAAEGTYLGEGYVCDPQPCPQPAPQTGGCCTTNPRMCQNLTSTDCATGNGSWLGATTLCSPDPVNPTTCCPANYNESGGVSVQDIFDFLAGYFGGDPRADINQSGTVTVQDIFDFLAAYFTGCA